MKVLLIAGEHSGDAIGAEIITALKKKGAEVFGIGGERMLRSGLSKSLFPIEKISLMGFLEVLPHAIEIKKLVKLTAQEIISINPNYIITIDSPGFNLRVIKALRKMRFKGKIYHAVAPTVWAYKEGRSKKFAKLYDKLFCILPFEPPFFTKDGLDAKYICYPPLFRLLPVLKPEPAEEKYFIFNIGSRESEIKKHLELAKEIVQIVEGSLPNITFVFPTVKQFENLIKENFPSGRVVTQEAERIEYLKRAHFCISKSGTAAIESAFFNLPSVIFYKGSFLSYIIIKAFLKIRFVNLINIMLNKELIPEFIQYKATAQNIANKAIEIFLDKEKTRLQVEGILEVKNLLITNVKYENFGEGVVQNL